MFAYSLLSLAEFIALFCHVACCSNIVRSSLIGARVCLQTTDAATASQSACSHRTTRATSSTLAPRAASCRTWARVRATRRSTPPPAHARTTASTPTCLTVSCSTAARSSARWCCEAPTSVRKVSASPR